MYKPHFKYKGHDIKSSKFIFEFQELSQYILPWKYFMKL
jgi:hypothetical protein